MVLTGIIRDSFQEYEGEHSLVLFCYGCNFICKECHNYKTVTDDDNIIGGAMEIIDSTLNVLHSAVVFLGGEPTMYDSLYSLCHYVKKYKKRKTKIYTNGSNYEVIKDLVTDNLLDSISIDIKCIRNVKDVIGIDMADKEYLENLNKLIDLFRSRPKIHVDLRTTKWECISDQLDDISDYVYKLNLPKNFKHIIQRKINGE